VGQPGNTNHTNVIAGTKTVTIVSTAGQMMTNSVYDIASGLLTDQQIYSDYDEQRRPRRVTSFSNSVSFRGSCPGAPRPAYVPVLLLCRRSTSASARASKMSIR
jgi:hypothetical protein